MSWIAALLPCLFLPPIREAVPPTPSPGIAVRLQAADQLLRMRQIPECIKAAQEAIKAARAAKDEAGEAQAHEIMADAILEVPLPETDDLNSSLLLFDAQEPAMRHAVEQWTDAAANWKKIEAVPEFIHAQAAAAFLCWSFPTQQFGMGGREGTDEAEKLLKEALQQGSISLKRRRETARTLNVVGASLCSLERNDWSARYLNAARLQAGSSEDMDTAAIDYNLGWAASQQQHFAEAKHLYLHSRAVMQKIQPDSLAMAMTLRRLTRDALIQGQKEEAQNYARQFEQQVYERNTFAEATPVSDVALFVCRRADGSEHLRAIAGLVFSPIAPQRNSTKLDPKRRSVFARSAGKGETPTPAMLANSAYEALRDVDELQKDENCYAMSHPSVMIIISQVISALHPKAPEGAFPLPSQADIEATRAELAHPGVCINLEDIHTSDKSWQEFEQRSAVMERDARFAQQWRKIGAYYRSMQIGVSGPRSERWLKTEVYEFLARISEAERQKLFGGILSVSTAHAPNGTVSSGLTKFADIFSVYANSVLDSPVKELDALVTSHKQALAWQHFEASRAESLYRYLRLKRILYASGNTENTRRIRQIYAKTWMLQEAMAVLTYESYGLFLRSAQLYLDNAPAEKIADAQQQQEKTKKAYSQVKGESENCFETIDRLCRNVPISKNEAPFAVSASQVRVLLPPRTTYIAFFTAEDHTLIFLFTPDSSSQVPEIFRIPVGRDYLNDQVEDLRERATRVSADEDEGLDASRKFYKTLFPPRLQAAIKKAGRLLLTPDGPLWDLPFAALVTNASGPPAYLGEQTPLTFIESIALLRETRRKRPSHSAPVKAVFFADPKFSSRTAFIPKVLNLSVPEESLAQTRPQVEQSAEVYHGVLYTGSNASETQARKALNEADIVHLMTHGLNSFMPFTVMSSGVCLASDDEPLNSEDLILDGRRETIYDEARRLTDGFLQAWEILAEEDIHTELVVLAACETSRGAPHAGSEQYGLSRGFLYAGTRSLVGTLWRVWDTSTGEMMTAFHKSVRAGLPKDEALRQAIVHMRKNPATAHPFHWAAFALSGNPDNPLFIHTAKTPSRSVH